jgi:hypothetical protein
MQEACWQQLLALRDEAADAARACLSRLLLASLLGSDHAHLYPGGRYGRCDVVPRHPCAAFSRRASCHASSRLEWAWPAVDRLWRALAQGGRRRSEWGQAAGHPGSNASLLQGSPRPKPSSDTGPDLQCRHMPPLHPPCNAFMR